MKNNKKQKNTESLLGLWMIFEEPKLKKNKINMENTFNIEIDVYKNDIKSNEEAIRQLQNAIYKVAAVFYECVGEHGSMLNGNGHHMAQDLSEKSKEIWIKHQALKK